MLKCELLQPMGQIEFDSIFHEEKLQTSLSLLVENELS